MLSTVGNRPQKSVQIFMHALSCMVNVSHIAERQWGGPVVAYCNPQLTAGRLHSHQPGSPNSLLKEAALPLVQIRHRGSLITDLEAIGKPQILPDQPDQIENRKWKKPGQISQKELGFPPLQKSGQLASSSRPISSLGPELL